MGDYCNGGGKSSTHWINIYLSLILCEKLYLPKGVQHGEQNRPSVALREFDETTSDSNKIGRLWYKEQKGAMRTYSYTM